jgi:hypothetical protein
VSSHPKVLSIAAPTMTHKQARISFFIIYLCPISPATSPLNGHSPFLFGYSWFQGSLEQFIQTSGATSSGLNMPPLALPDKIWSTFMAPDLGNNTYPSSRLLSKQALSCPFPITCVFEIRSSQDCMH